MAVDKQIEIACGCCTEHYPEGLMVEDDDFGLICPTCDLATAEAEWDGRKEAKEDFSS
jgi:hypothetical protein